MPRKKIDHSEFSTPAGGKPWQNFLSKINKFKTESTENWSEYQVLGYLLDSINKMNRIQLNICYEGEPNKHPFLIVCKKIIIALHQPDFKNDPYASALRLMPRKDQWNREKVKSFIDWSIKRVMKGKNSIHSLDYLLHDKSINEFLSQYGSINRSEQLNDQIKKLVPEYINTFSDLVLYSQIIKLDDEIINILNTQGVDLSKIT